MKTRIYVLLASSLIAVAKPIDAIEPSDSLLVPPDIVFPEEPIACYAGLRDALSDLHEKRSAVKGYLQTVCKLSNEDAVRALKHLIDNLAGSESFRDKDDRFQAICCIRDYPCEEAYAFLEHLLADETEPERRAVAYSLTRMSLGDSARLARLREIADTIPTENWARQEVYQTIATHLQYAGPSSSNQMSLVRFLLNRTIVDAQLFDMLDEILCREVPKWRASPQRAENAAKMIREHPDDAGLVAFFETVRTNALESARTALSAVHAGVTVSSGTNQTERASPQATERSPADPDPWAGLLDDLPEKKSRTPPPDWEPPF